MDPRAKTGLVCSLFVTALIFLCWFLIVDVASVDSNGQLYVDITRFSIENKTDPLQVGVETGGSYQGYSPWLNSTQFVRISFRNVSDKQEILVTGLDTKRKETVCKMIFNIYDIALAGYLNFHQEYQATKNCVIRMKVAWIRGSESV